MAIQSEEHPDGWGVAYYLSEMPHLIKSADRALNDKIFRRVSGVVASETVLAHLRKATVGELNILNSHPFQHGRWVLAHNGEINNFAESRFDLKNRIAPKLRRYILGDTDSEVFFFLFLTHLSQRADLQRRGTPVEEIVGALTESINQVRELSDGYTPEERSLLSILVTDGATMVGICWGRPLFYSTFKKECLDRDNCAFFAPECEAPPDSGFVKHLLVSSEPLQGENVWSELGIGGIVAVDWRMRLFRADVEAPEIAVPKEPEFFF